MIVTRSWLNEWIDLKGITTADLCKTFNAIGLEVDSLNTYNIPEKIVFGKVLECEKHPDADKLNICKVDIGSTTRQIVCGASNVRTGLDVVVATIGAEMPGGLTIKPVKLRGIDSEGMICSASEIGLDNVNEGILELDTSIELFELGDEVSTHPIFSDDIIEIELTANRGDCLSMRGVARDLSAALDRPLKDKKLYDSGNKKGVGRLLHLAHNKEVDINLNYKVLELKNLKIPMLVKLRLSQINESEASDINSLIQYSVHNSGVILRAYNFGFFCAENEIMAKVKLNEDENGFVAIESEEVASTIGVMQSENSKVTYDEGIVILEASYIAPDIISKKMADTKIESDTFFYKTSRGSEPDLDSGITSFLNILETNSDSSSFSGAITYGKSHSNTIISLTKQEVDDIIGASINKVTISKILQNLGFGLSKSSADSFVIEVPQYRHDITNKQDIIEEIVRMVGIDNIPSKAFEFTEENKLKDDYFEYKKRSIFRHRAANTGFFESVHFVFDEKKVLQKYNFPVTDENLELLNPIVNTLDTLRSTLLTGLLKAASNNVKSGYSQVKLFEIGSVFSSTREETLKMSMLFSGTKEEENLTNTGKPVSIDFPSFVQKISDIIGAFELVKNTTSHTLSHLYQSASIVVDGQSIGELFRVHPDVENEYDLGATYLCEIDFNKIPYGLKTATKTSKYQASNRDLSIIIPKNMSFEDVKNVIKTHATNELVNFYPVDKYSDESLGENISLSLRFILQSNEKTLEEEDITFAMDSILNGLKKELGIGLRE